jgi:DNA-binding LacI/PurR family transcriptional regulator
MRQIDPDARERQAGFVAACKRAGLKDEQFKVFMAGLNATSGTISEILQSKPSFTAILTANDFHAFQIEREAAALGVHIPRDLSVATFSSSVISSRNWSGPRTEFVEFGILGVKLLTRQSGGIQHIRIRPTWHDGDSLAPRRRG